MPNSSSSSSSDPWRTYGRIRRQWLLENDEQYSSLRVHPSTSIDKYMQLVQQLWEQFCITKEHADRKEVAYVLGRRLFIFLRDDFPQHPSYGGTASLLAANTTASLAVSLEQLALQIDEEQLNLYMDREMDPVLAEEEEEEAASSWEAFDGWDNSVPGMVETDDSSNDIDEVMVSSVPSSPVYGDGDHDIDAPPSHKPRYTYYQEGPHDEEEEEEEAEQYADPDEQRYADPEAYWDDDDSEEYHDVHNESSSGFLQTIARQSVEFESDSEAADSWAQEPADRFEQELQRHAQALQSLQKQLELLQADAQVALL